MFTGIIEGLGTISGVNTSGRGKQLTITSEFDLSQVKLGDSIAVSGACLTVVRLSGKQFTVDVAPETLNRTILQQAKVGDRVNLERALRLSDRLDGHLVSGHVDGKGAIRDRKSLDNAIIITVSVPGNLLRYMIEKGSVAIDGISLTINQLHSDAFDISVIPHTAKLTTIGFKPVGAAVNIETDMIGKYVERFLLQGGADAQGTRRGGKSIDLKFLSENGFV